MAKDELVIIKSNYKTSDSDCLVWNRERESLRVVPCSSITAKRLVGTLAPEATQ